MPSFVADGHKCSVVDYPTDMIPGVQHLGLDLDHIPAGNRFDIIICSHVLEHLAEPLTLVNRLADFLEEAGILYVEVPLEIWKSAPLQLEPVTHINFFTLDSLRILLDLAGYKVHECMEGLYTTEMGGRGFAIRAFASIQKAPHKDKITFTDSANATLELVSPSWITRLRRIFKYPELLPKLIKGHLKRILPKTFFWRFFS